MKPLRFYEHFACAYGTLWLLIFVAAFASQSHINAGAFGVFGFPIIALIYAIARTAGTSAQVDDRTQMQWEVRKLREKLEDIERAQARDGTHEGH